MRNICVYLAAVFFAAACGGGGGGSSFTPTDESPTGIWEGVITFDDGESSEVAGVVAENGEAVIVTDDLQLLWGSMAGVDRKPFTVSYEWALPPGFMTPGGAFGGTGQLTCNFVERVSMDCSFTSTSTVGEVFRGTVGASYDNLYEDDASLTVITGVWLDTDTGTETLNIDAAGNAFSQDAATGCVLDGTMQPIDPDFNAYDVSLILDGCTDPDLAPANGTRFDGLGVVSEELQPQDTLIIGIHGEFMGVPIALAAEYRRM